VPIALKLHGAEFQGKKLRISKCEKNPTPGGSTTGKPAQNPKGNQGSKSLKKRKRNDSNVGEGPKVNSKKPKVSQRASAWKKGHEAKKRKTAKELPRKLAKKVKKLNSGQSKK
jgi:nucleolar protein 12